MSLSEAFDTFFEQVMGLDGAGDRRAAAEVERRSRQFRTELAEIGAMQSLLPKASAVELSRSGVNEIDWAQLEAIPVGVHLDFGQGVSGRRLALDMDDVALFELMLAEDADAGDQVHPDFVEVFVPVRGELRARRTGAIKHANVIPAGTLHHLRSGAGCKGLVVCVRSPG